MQVAGIVASAEALTASSRGSESHGATLALTDDIFSPLRRSKLQTRAGVTEQRLILDDLEETELGII